jgi:Zn-dependent M28 family amino/carboxypeptidase
MTIKSLIMCLPLILIGCAQEQAPSAPTPNITTDTPPKAAIAVDINTVAINAITTTGLVGHIQELASDEYGGRAPGTKGEELTVKYLTENFKKIGLEPANGQSYTQAVPLTSVEAINKPGLLISGGTGKDLALRYLDDQVIGTRRQLDESSIANSQLVFVGYGINAPERNWNDYASVDVRGKTVVILVNDPGFATQDPQLFNGNAMTYYGRWSYKFEEATRQGAAGAIIVHDTKPAGYPWSTVSSSWSGPQFGLVRTDKGQNLINVEGWVTKDNATALFKKAGLTLDDMYKAAKIPGFKAIELNLTATATIKNTTANVDSRNVAGVIKGSESPDDVFIYMAHWDHIGTDPSIEGDGIYNGALDNATGTAGLIEIAKAYASQADKPKRSVMFLAVTAEEQGLLGSAYYAANPLYPLANTIGGLNMDVLNNFGPTRDITVIGKGMSQLESYLEKRAKDQQRELKPDAQAEKGYFYRSDHFELAKRGVPMLYPNSGYDHHENGIQYGMQKSKEYVANHYHGPSDEYNASWDLSGAVLDLQLYFHTGQDIVNSMAWPEWHEGTEFKAARTAQRASAQKAN